jgi:hypothetical protein
MSKKRFFSFGCSFTKDWNCPTWADFIGIQFDEYYNLAMPGSSNTLIMQRFIESDLFYNFNKDTDVIMIAISGLGRVSFPVTKYNAHVNRDMDHFFSRGDIDSCIASDNDTPEILEIVDFIKTKFYKKRYGVFDSFIAVKVMKDLLTAKGIEHKIFASLDYKIYIDNADIYDMDYQLKSYVIKLQDMLDIKESINEFDNFSEHHPIPKTYYSFLEKHIPKYIGEKSKELLNTDFSENFNGWMIKKYPEYQMLNEFDSKNHPTFCFGYF